MEKIKYFFQRLIRGYDDPAWWGLNEYIVRKAIKPLKHLRKQNNGFPHELTQKEWNKILDEIIWSFEKFLKDDFTNKNWKKDYERMQKGFELFGKHLTDLWD